VQRFEWDSHVVTSHLLVDMAGNTIIQCLKSGLTSLTFLALSLSFRSLLSVRRFSIVFIRFISVVGVNLLRMFDSHVLCDYIVGYFVNLCICAAHLIFLE